MIHGSTLAAVVLVAAATLGGAAFAGTFRNARRTALGIAATALGAVVALDLGPDVVRDVAAAGSDQPVVGAACIAAFAIAAVTGRWVCACSSNQARTTTAVAITLHRALEGAALALVGSVGVIAALVLHAAGEGFALRVSGDRRHGTSRPLLILACLSPAIGALALSDVSLPGMVSPIVTALIAGALAAGAAHMLRAAGATAAPYVRNAAGR